jgi:hypothetical protein
MRFLWLRAAVVAVVGLFALAPTAEAWADTGATINSANVPTSAADFTNTCDANAGGGPLPGQDVWVFVLPDSSRDFVKITANFDTDGDGITNASRTAPAAGGISTGPGTSKGWVLTPAGWVLISATAVVTGAAADGVSFNLAHTCPANGRPGPSASASRTASPRPSASTTSTGSPSASPSTSETVAPPPTTRPPSGTGPKPSGGPQTGGGGSFPTASSLLLGGGSLLAAVAGAGLLIRARRRRNGM